MRKILPRKVLLCNREILVEWVGHQRRGSKGASRRRVAAVWVWIFLSLNFDDTN